MIEKSNFFFFTIITVVKNDERNIKNTIRSVLNQTYKNFQYIVIDGNSTDKTYHILKNIKDRRLFLLQRKDKNFYDGLNFALKKTQGKYIGILNSGDIFFDEKILYFFKKNLKKKNVNYFFSNLIYHDSKLNIKRVWKYPILNASQLNYKKIPHPTLFVNRKIIKDLGYYDTNYSISSDIDYLLRLTKLKKNFIYFNKFSIFMKTGGLSTNPFFLLKKFIQDIKILFKYFSFIFFIELFLKVIVKIPDFFYTNSFIEKKLKLNYKKLNQKNEIL